MADAVLGSAAFVVMNAKRRRLAEDLFRKLREMSFDGVGISRETYGPGETAAMRLIEQLATRHGIQTRWDAARNLVVTLPGREPERPVVASGSHLDSVPRGGNFDGAAGVIATFMALLAAKERGPLLRTLELYVLRGEESAWYGGPCYFGSRALFGLLTQDDLASRHRLSGESLADNMAKAGVDMAPITEARHLVDPAHFHCWMELHIEQGPVLVAKDKPVGIVTGIRGNVRTRASSAAARPRIRVPCHGGCATTRCSRWRNCSCASTSIGAFCWNGEKTWS